MHNERDISNYIQKYIEGEISREELDVVFSIFEDPYHNLEIRPTLYKLWTGSYADNLDLPKSNELDGLLNEIHHQINLGEKSQNKSETRKLLFNLSKIASVLIIGIFLGILVQTLNKPEPVYYTSVSPMGSISQMILPDSTMVFLNAGSEIKYSIEGVNGQREVFLKGEAWFQVTKNIDKPFVVHTPCYNVNVLGTEFNVKAYPADDNITTTLEKGSIQITSTENFKIQNNQILKPGEQLVYNKYKNSIELKQVNTKLCTSWKENKLIFINMSLKELAILLERKYGVDIEVSDLSILEYHYDGIIKNETIFEIMDIIKETLPIEYKIVGQKLRIFNN